MKHFKTGERSGGDRGEGRTFSKGFRKDFKKDFKKDFGRPGFGGKPRFGGGGGFRDRGDTPQFEAVCANCGKTCQVPFRPNGKRPVYCKECYPQFASQLENAPDRPRYDRNTRPSRDFSPRPSSGGGDARVLESIAAKLDRLIAILEKSAPSGVPLESAKKAEDAATPSLAKKKSKKAAKKSE